LIKVAAVNGIGIVVSLFGLVLEHATVVWEEFVVDDDDSSRGATLHGTGVAWTMTGIAMLEETMRRNECCWISSNVALHIEYIKRDEREREADNNNDDESECMNANVTHEQHYHNHMTLQHKDSTRTVSWDSCVAFL
jgi:hypothetical protein